MSNKTLALYDLLKTYNQTSQLNSIYKIYNNNFTFYDLKKELFKESINHLVANSLYRELLKACVK